MQEITVHPKGEHTKGELVPVTEPVAVETSGGRIHAEWNPQAAVAPLGQLPFFIDFLQVSGLFDGWVSRCPLRWTSPNAPNKRDVLGTVLLSVLSGHQRYAHINAIRGDGVNPGLPGMSKVVSEDSVRRSFSGLDEAEGVAWLQDSLQEVYAPLLSESGRSWMRIRRSRLCMVGRKDRKSATTRTSRGVRRIPTTPT